MEDFNTLRAYIETEENVSKEIKSRVLVESKHFVPTLKEEPNMDGLYLLILKDEEIISKEPTKLLKIICEKGYTSLHFGTLDTLLPTHYIDHLIDEDYPGFMETVDRIMKVCS